MMMSGSGRFLHLMRWEISRSSSHQVGRQRSFQPSVGSIGQKSAPTDITSGSPPLSPVRVHATEQDLLLPNSNKVSSAAQKSLQRKKREKLGIWPNNHPQQSTAVLFIQLLVSKNSNSELLIKRSNSLGKRHWGWWDGHCRWSSQSYEAPPNIFYLRHLRLPIPLYADATFQH